MDQSNLDASAGQGARLPSPPAVALVDDDRALSNALLLLLSSIGMHAEAFGSASELLNVFRPERFNCLVLDLRLPDKSGLELFSDLAKGNVAIPTIFMSGYADVRITVKAMKAGAIDFLPKPFGEDEFLDAVHAAIQVDQLRRTQDGIRAELRRRFDLLTPREQELMGKVVTGKRNKRIASDLGVSDVTVKAHRIQLMRKMAAESVPELIGMAQLLGQEEGTPQSLVSRLLRRDPASAHS